MTFSKNAVDPDKIQKDPAYNSNFKVEIHFKDICYQCKPTDSIESKCDYCRQYMEVDLEYWMIIDNILKVKNIYISFY